MGGYLRLGRLPYILWCSAVAGAIMWWALHGTSLLELDAPRLAVEGCAFSPPASRIAGNISTEVNKLELLTNIYLESNQLT